MGTLRLRFRLRVECISYADALGEEVILKLSEPIVRRLSYDLQSGFQRILCAVILL